ncbi:hypothetical protein [Sorangium sp. So ce861]|uniref:hypothetical protein n=1 Tax=Sorangium sp. So ce861 TaxID=3133323 RepID=UPI003F5EA5DD
MEDDLAMALVALGSAALADDAAALSTRWNELHAAGDGALARRGAVMTGERALSSRDSAMVSHRQG